MPRLCSISYYDFAGGHSMRVLVPFIVPNLTEFTIYHANYAHVLYDSSSALLEILNSLRTNCLNLKKLSIDVTVLQNDDQMLVRAAISQLVCSTLHLQELDCGHFHPQPHDIYHLSSLAAMQSLTVAVTPAHRAVLDTIIREQVPRFLALRRIQLIAGPDDCALFFRVLPIDATIWRIDISIDREYTAPQLHNFFHTLSHHCKSSSLRELIIHFTQFYDASHLSRLDYPIIQTLMSFGHLECVKLNTFDTLDDVDDTVLREIVKAWPRLHTFHITVPYRIPYRRTSKVTLSGLGILAQCPALVHLSIPFDSDTPVDLPTVLRPQHCLRSLTFTNTSLKNPEKVINYVTQTFPCLESIQEYKNILDASYEDEWQRALQLFNEYRAGRNRETATGESS